MKNTVLMVMEIDRFDGDGLLELKRGRERHAQRRHVHAGWSLNTVLQGTTLTIVGSREFRLKPGEFVWIPAGVSHLCVPEDASEFEYAVWYGDEAVPLPSRFTPESVVIGTVDVHNHRRTLDKAVQRRELSAERVLTPVLETIETSTAVSGGVPSKISVDGLYKSTEPTVSRDVPPGNRYREYRMYRRRYGMTRHEHTQAVRVEKAKKLLRSGMSVAGTAAECEFYDQSHLVKTFRMLTGMTPSQYRHAR